MKPLHYKSSVLLSVEPRFYLIVHNKLLPRKFGCSIGIGYHIRFPRNLLSPSNVPTSFMISAAMCAVSFLALFFAPTWKAHLRNSFWTSENRNDPQMRYVLALPAFQYFDAFAFQKLSSTSLYLLFLDTSASVSDTLTFTGRLHKLFKRNTPGKFWIA